MSRVKFFINEREPGAVAMADQMREAGIEFSSVPTSGPMTLWIDGHASYGPTAVKYSVRRLIELFKVNPQASNNLVNRFSQRP